MRMRRATKPEWVAVGMHRTTLLCIEPRPAFAVAPARSVAIVVVIVVVGGGGGGGITDGGPPTCENSDQELDEAAAVLALGQHGLCRLADLSRRRGGRGGRQRSGRGHR